MPLSQLNDFSFSTCAKMSVAQSESTRNKIKPLTSYFPRLAGISIHFPLFLGASVERLHNFQIARRHAKWSAERKINCFQSRSFTSPFLQHEPLRAIFPFNFAMWKFFVFWNRKRKWLFRLLLPKTAGGECYMIELFLGLKGWRWNWKISAQLLGREEKMNKLNFR